MLCHNWTIAHAVGHCQRDEMDVHPQGTGSLEGVLELLAAAFRYLGGADWTGPDSATDQQALVKRLLMDPLHDLDVTQGLTGYRGAVNHALACPGIGKELVHYRLEGPPVGPGQLGVRFGNFTGLWVKSTGLRAAL